MVVHCGIFVWYTVGFFRWVTSPTMHQFCIPQCNCPISQNAPFCNRNVHIWRMESLKRYFAHVTTVTLSWRVQNIVVIGRVYFTLERSEFSSNFEFDRNMLSGTGAWLLYYQTGSPRSWIKDQHKNLSCLQFYPYSYESLCPVVGLTLSQVAKFHNCMQKQ